MPSEVLSLWSRQEASGGRDIELTALLRELDEARMQGRPRFVFVRGPAGVGKSHFFRQFRQQLAGRQVEVFEGESPRDARRAFGLFGQLVPALLEHLAHAGTPADTLVALSRRVLPLSREVPEPVSHGERLGLFDAASELFVLAGRTQPVFLFPDLDAADKGSLELFRYLTAVVTAPESRAGGVFVASFRDDAALPEPLREVLQKVSARTLSLAGLDLEGIRGFLSQSEVAQRLFEVTGGMPDELEALLTRPSPRPAELFLRRVQRLSEGAREVLTVLAIAPRALTQDAVCGALAQQGLEPRGAAAELDGLVRGHLLSVKVLDGQPAYRFTRELERDAWLAELPHEVRLRATVALGRFFAQVDALADAATLLLEGAPEEGGRLALAAAERLASRGANEEAVELFERGLAVVPPQERPAVHRRLAELAAARADLRLAIHHLSRARIRGDRAALPALCTQAARYLVRLGRTSRAERLLAQPLASGDGEIVAMAQVLQVEIALLRGRPDEAIRLADAALPGLAGRAEQGVLLRNAKGRAHLLRGELEAADGIFEANIEAARTAGLTTEAARALINRGIVAHKQGDRDRAIRFYQAAAPAQERSVEARALANLGSLYAESGDFELAEEHLTRALQSFSRLGNAREVAHAASNLARLQSFLGDLARAKELSEHALRRAQEIGERYLEASALLNLGEVLLDRREPQEASALLGEARAMFEEVGNAGFAALCGAQKARAHLQQGERAQASEELSRAVIDPGCAALPAAQIEAELVRGELALSLGDLHGAGRAATRAREALLHKPDLEGPYRVYFLMGRLRLAAGDMSGAQAEMVRSARLLDEVLQRVPPARRHAFAAVPRRAEVLGAVEPELRLPRLQSQPVARSAAHQTHGLIGRSEALVRITRQLEPIARSNATVLIRGESGTGKEVLAQAIHDLSPRRAMPIVKVNCAAMVEDLLLSELFGHEKGAFTGAIRERKGRFELADGGTLFLDEIGDISPRCQVALLRVLQEREFERVGGTRTLKVDVRVICATNRDLETLITQGRFRQDLYYRLKGVMLELPALRERMDDLPVLAQHFLTRAAQERNEAPRQLSGESLALLSKHTWPGNVRELENVIASAAIFAEGQVITPDCFSHITELQPVTATAKAHALPPSRPVEPAAVVGPVVMSSRAVSVTPPVAAPAAVTAPVPLPPGQWAAEEPDDDDALEGSGSAASVDDIDFYALARTRGMSLKDLRRQLELQCIRRALLEAKGNISEAARLLMMKRSRLSQIVNSEPELKGVCHGDE